MTVELFDNIASVYDGINRILSLGIDMRWRKQLLQHVPKFPDQILCDLATGTADQLITLAKSPFITKCYGFDLSTNMLLLGQKKLAKKGLRKKTLLQVGNALSIPVANGFCDLATISFGIRNVSEPGKCLTEMYRILKPQGTALILEFSLPSSPLIKGPYLLYLRHILPRIGGLLSKQKEAYQYLNRTIESFPSGASFLELMHSANFSECRHIPLSFGIASLYIGKKQ